MSFTIKLQKSKSDINVVTKNIEDVLTVEGELRAETSLIRPIIRIETLNESVFNCNYMTIDSFGGRKYFIDDITSVRNGLIQISAHVDVLSTYDSQIRRCTGIVSKQATNYNLYLDDGTLKAYNNPIIVTKAFPSGFTGESYLLLVAGS